MTIVGLTGGIGSGKSTVAKFFEDLGIPVYVADVEAKRLMNSSKVIRRKLIGLFGEETYENGSLNRPYIASKIFNDKQLLEQMNAIVHPKVASDFKKWAKRQTSDYIIKEAAIIFEIGAEAQYDAIITVIAPEHERIQRVIKRDSTTAQKVKSIIKNQMPDEEKADRSDFVIINDTLQHARTQVLEIHKKLLSASAAD